ncbi:hypothetical protein OC844_003152 [Tilletia horrida]|nr:hypothetical protein OC844_003152 [Tilletia horrida]
MSADISTNTLPTYPQQRSDSSCALADYTLRSHTNLPSPPDSTGSRHASEVLSPGCGPLQGSAVFPSTHLGHSERPGSRHSSYASLSTPASTTSSIFPSNATVITTTSTTSTTKSSGMSSPASASEQCFTPATSTATTSPSSAPHALGAGPAFESKKPISFALANADFDAASSDATRKQEGGETLWWRRHMNGHKSADGSGQNSHDSSSTGLGEQPQRLASRTSSFLSSTSSNPWQPSIGTNRPNSSTGTGAASPRQETQSASSQPPFALKNWGPGSGLSLPNSLFASQEARSPWYQQGNGELLSSGSQSISSTAASSPQQRWFNVGDRGGDDKGDGSLGLSLHQAATMLPKHSSSHLAAPTLMTTPSSPTSASGGHGMGSAASDGNANGQLDSLNFALALQQITAESERANSGARAAFSAAPVPASSQHGLGFVDHVFAGSGRGGLGRGVGNGIRSDGVWSASVSPSMTIQPLPMTSSGSAANFGGSTPVPGLPHLNHHHHAQHLLARTGGNPLAPFSTSSAGYDAAATSRPRSATAAPSTAAAAAAALNSSTLASADVERALNSPSFLKGFATSGGAERGISKSGMHTPFSTDLHHYHHHLPQDAVSIAAAAAVAALSLPPSSIGLTSSSAQHSPSMTAGSSGGLASALGLTTAVGGAPHVPLASVTNSAAAAAASAVPSALMNMSSGTSSLSAPASAFGSPATFSMPLLPGDANQVPYPGANGGGPSPNNRKLNLYKTELCRNWEEKGSCRYGVKCQYAHGEAELRPVERHAKYKTEICRTFWRTGSCPYAKRCCFIHTTAADAGGMELSSAGGGAPLLARVSGDRLSQGSSVAQSVPNSPLVAMNSGSLLGLGGTGQQGAAMGAQGSSQGGAGSGKPDPLALSSLNDALAGLNLGMTSSATSHGSGGAMSGDSATRFRHQASASMGGSSSGASGHGHGHNFHAHGHGHGHGHGPSLLGSGPRFFKGPVQ